MRWWIKLDHILNIRRMRYAYITGGVLWFAWLLSIFLGSGNMDLAGQVIGTDYIQFYASGVTLQQGQSSRLYDFQYQSQLEQEIAGPGLTNFHAFITPPFLAWLFVPLSFLPYTWSFVAWSLAGFLFLFVSIRLLSSDRNMHLVFLALTWFPIFAAISFGQNSLLSLLLLSLIYHFWRKRKLLIAGLVCSLLLFKPQMILGVGILWLLEWRKDWKAILGLAVGGIALAAISLLTMPEASLAYIHLSRDFLPGLIYGDQFPLWHLHSLRGFWVLLFPEQKWLSEGLSILFSLVGLLAFYIFWRKNQLNPDLLFAMAISLTIWISPHAMIYDWSILLIPAVLLYRSLPTQNKLWKPMFALIWLVTFISGPLTLAQLKVLPVAVQVSIPVFLLVFYTIWKIIIVPGTNQVEVQTTAG